MASFKDYLKKSLLESKKAVDVAGLSSAAVDTLFTDAAAVKMLTKAKITKAILLDRVKKAIEAAMDSDEVNNAEAGWEDGDHIMNIVIDETDNVLNLPDFHDTDAESAFDDFGYDIRNIVYALIDENINS